jgi:hypothetical protein
VGGVQVVRRADDEVVRRVARLAEEFLEVGTAGENRASGKKQSRMPTESVMSWHAMRVPPTCRIASRWRRAM